MLFPLELRNKVPAEKGARTNKAYEKEKNEEIYAGVSVNRVTEFPPHRCGRFSRHIKV